MSDNPNALRIVKKPELATVGSRAVSVHGWRLPLVEDHLKWHLAQEPSKRWCTVECMARTIFQRSTPTTREGIRRRMAKAFRALLSRGLFLVIEYKLKPHRQITACKILENTEGLEIQHALEQADWMRRRRQMSEETYLTALQLIGYKPSENE